MVTQFLQSVFPYDEHREWGNDRKHLPFIHNREVRTEQNRTEQNRTEQNGKNMDGFIIWGGGICFRFIYFFLSFSFKLQNILSSTQRLPPNKCGESNDSFVGTRNST